MTYKKAFKMPTRLKITGRSSSITNAFVNSIIPAFEPSDEQVKQALEILEISPDKVVCAYCGSPSTEWDHLRPLVRNKMATGYITEIQNLVPACGKCNQSKGNKYWKDWIMSDAKLSPKTKGVPDLTDRIRRLERYEDAWKPTRINFDLIVGSEVMKKHQKNKDEIIDLMGQAQIHAETISKIVAKRLKDSK